MQAIVSDVGGTNARFALAEAGRVVPDSVRRYRNDDHASYLAALDAYRHEIGAGGPAAIAVAVAGPVAGGRARMTNRDWVLDAAELGAHCGGRAVLINDLTALGFSLGRLAPEALVPIVADDGSAPANGQALVLGMGTGCNVSPVCAPGGRVHCLEAEFGHSSLPASVMDRLRGRLGAGANAFPTVEHLFSGPGLARLHGALCGQPPGPAEAVVAAASGADPAATACLELFAGMLGLLARNLAIAYLPGDGIFFAGSVSRAVLESPAQAAFAEAVAAKGPEAIEIGTIPVRLITDDYAPLLGCAYAMEVAGE